MSVTVDRSSLTFVAVNASPSSQVVHLALTGGSGTYYAAVVVDRDGLFTGDLIFTGQTTATATFTTSSPPLGTTAGNITFLLCKDAACASVAWSKVIPYTVKGFTVAPTSLSFSGSEGAAATPQTVNVSPADDAQDLVFTPITPWVGVAREGPTTWRVTPTAQALAAGNHTGRIVVAPRSGGSQQDVLLSFAVATGLVASPDVTHVLDLSGATTGSLPVAFRGGIGPAWTATKDQSWLTLTQASGTGAGAVQYAIDVAQLGAVANWSSAVANVQISSPGLTPVTLHLVVEKRLPDVYVVSPAAIRAGQAASVHVFGKGLSQIVDADAIAVSGASGASTTVLSDREAVVSIPAVGAGRAAISVPNPFSIATGTVDLAVAAAGAWTAGLVPDTGEKRCAVFDPLRNAVYAVEQYDEDVVRFRLVSGSWQVDEVPLAAVGDLGLSADRDTVYVTEGDALYGYGTLRTLDPETLVFGATTYTLPRNGASLVTGAARSTGLQVTNDGRLWFNMGGWATPTYFDLLARTFGTRSLPGGSIDGVGVLASPDGSRMIVAEHAEPPYVYTAADGAISQRTAPAMYGVAVAASRDGRVLVIDRNVYEAETWTMRGSATVAGTGVMGTAAQLSPDGSKVYVLVQSTTLQSYPVLRLDVFDTSSVVAGTTDLVKLGEIPVADQAAYCAPGSWSTCSMFPQVLVGPLGDVLFIYGNQGLVVVPVPTDLAGAP